MTGVKLGDRLLVIGCAAGEAGRTTRAQTGPHRSRVCARRERSHVDARCRDRLAGRRAPGIRNGTVHKPPPQRLSLRHRRPQPHPGRDPAGTANGRPDRSEASAARWGPVHRNRASAPRGAGIARRPARSRHGGPRGRVDNRRLSCGQDARGTRRNGVHRRRQTKIRPPVLSGRQLSQGAYTPAVPRLTDFREKGRKTMRGLQRRRSNPRQVFCPLGQAG